MYMNVLFLGDVESSAMPYRYLLPRRMRIQIGSTSFGAWLRKWNDMSGVVHSSSSLVDDNVHTPQFVHVSSACRIFSYGIDYVMDIKLCRPPQADNRKMAGRGATFSV